MENKEEIFKDIKGYEGLYQVSNLGKVKSLNYLHTRKEKVLKFKIDKNGYFQVNLYKNGKHKMFKVHRLVAMTFITNPNNLPQINHKDEVKTNNNVDNLEWCTCKYNSNYGTRNERISKVVLQYDKEGNFIREFSSTREVERQLGYLHGYISACCIGKRKTAYGYIWEYK